MLQAESTPQTWQQCSGVNFDPLLYSKTNHLLSEMRNDNIAAAAAAAATTTTTTAIGETHHHQHVNIDCDIYKQEIDDFFDYNDLLATLREYYHAYQQQYLRTQNQRKFEPICVSKLKDDLERSKSDDRLKIAQSIAYITLGCFCEGDVLKSERKMIEAMVANIEVICSSGLVRVLFRLLFDEAQNIPTSENTCISSNHEKLIDTYLTILYMSVITNAHRGKALKSLATDIGDDAPALLLKIVNTNKTADAAFPNKKLYLLLHRIFIIYFGNIDEAKAVKDQVRLLYGLPADDKDKLLKTGPKDLYNFQCDIKNKYTSYRLFNNITHPIVGAAVAVGSLDQVTGNSNSTDDDTTTSRRIPYQEKFPPKLSHLPTPKATTPPPPSSSSSKDDTPSTIEYKRQIEKQQSSTPFALGTPKAIEEAGQLYVSCMHLSVSQFQIIQERKKLLELDKNTDRCDHYHIEQQQQSKSGVIDSNMTQNNILQKVDRFYTIVVKDLPVVVTSLLQQLVTTAPTPPSPKIQPFGWDDASNDLEHADIVRNREIVRTTISSILLLLLKWLKASHVMKFEYLSQLLADSGYLMLGIRSLMIEDLIVAYQTKSDVDSYAFFAQRPFLNFSRHGEISSSGCSSSSSFSTSYAWDPPAPESPSIKSADMPSNQRNKAWILNTLRILQMMTKDKPLRNRTLAQYKAYMPLKRVTKHNKDSIEELYALKLLKSEVQYLGPKWRSDNMKTVSSISRRCPMGLRDDWLSLSDDEENEQVYEKKSETNMRLLVKLYHERHYDIDTLDAISRDYDGGKTNCGNNNYINGKDDGDGDDCEDDDDDDDRTYRGFSDSNELSSSTTPTEQLARQIVHLFKQPLKRRLNIKQTQVVVETDGWDAPSPLRNTAGDLLSQKGELDCDDDDDIDTDDDEDEFTNKEKDDPLKDIDWNSLTDEELNARMNMVEEQTEQRWLSVDLDDPAHCKVLNMLEIIDGDENETDTPAAEDEGIDDPWL
ncbi:hypothetical protein BDB00DRAFT_926965 [Zychaea mexicana]|uniref:uncharacterized protein n=1 Tax=Zychaea mexicana TaxID=64656 RepID=UPI0022FEC25E|nr:uncharacterized protein BDB00DRAFT_926965 [Zychaea mexicana]KAI9496153.1 hypothetical protein BDB00DRAFT_926965 [Zychaea mexicana]